VNGFEIVSIVGLLGWLFIAGSALASYRLGWSRIAQLALVWLAIFGAGFLIVSLVKGS
jgi:hypothetical protein